MNTNDQRWVATVAEAAWRELRQAHERIRHCLSQLEPDAIWTRPAPGMNSFGHLLLHLSGNLRQWIISGIGGAPDHRDRPAEFADREPLPLANLNRTLAETLEECRQVLERTTAEKLREVQRIQGFELTGLDALFDTVSHFRGHAQEIIHMTRRLLGDRYRFAFVPATVEQGAPHDEKRTDVEYDPTLTRIDGQAAPRDLGEFR